MYDLTKTNSLESKESEDWSLWLLTCWIILFKTPSFKISENQKNCVCDKCLMTLWDAALIPSKADYFSSERGIN